MVERCDSLSSSCVALVVRLPDQYAVLVAKHADGFTLWPSKSYEPLGINYTVADSPYVLHARVCIDLSTLLALSMTSWRCSSSRAPSTT